MSGNSTYFGCSFGHWYLWFVWNLLFEICDFAHTFMHPCSHATLYYTILQEPHNLIVSRRLSSFSEFLLSWEQSGPAEAAFLSVLRPFL